MTDQSSFTDDDELEIDVRPALEIAVRLVILAAVVRRAMLEVPLDDDAETDDSPEGWHFDTKVAISEEPFASRITRDERRFLSAPIGSFGEQAALIETWRAEALAAIASLSLSGLPLSDPWKQAEIGPLLSAIPELTEEFTAFVNAVIAPTDEDAAFERERAELWSWRVAIDDDLRSLTGSDLTDLRSILEETVAEAVESGLLPQGRRDFLIGKLPFGAADVETKTLIAEISVQRLTALNWLCGFGNSWDTVPLDL